MKFRTDFVTNSSSSSFMSVTLNFTDSESQEIQFFEESSGCRDYFKQTETGVSFQGYPIKTIDELFACLYFYNYGDEAGYPESSIVPVFTSVFLFITKKIDFNTMMERIRTYKQECDNHIRELAALYPDEYDEDDSLDWNMIDELESISPKDYENEDELIEAVNEAFENEGAWGNGNDEILDFFVENTDKYQNLSDIESFELCEECSEYGEFLNHYTEDLPDDIDFPQMDEDDPLFDKEVKRWTDIIFEKLPYGVKFDREPDIEAALKSGDIEMCFIKITHADNESRDRFFISNKKPTAENDLEEESSEESSVNDFSESEVYFKLEDCVSYKYYSDEERLERIREIIKSGIVPHRFTLYPITDIFDRIIEIIRDDYCVEYFDRDIENPHDDYYDEYLDELYREYEDFLHSNEINSWKELNKLIEERIIEKNKQSDDKLLYESMYECLNILSGIGLELDYHDVAHYIYNDTLENLYPLFDRGLKIDPSAYDDLITYASGHGKPEYTAWLLDQKNKAPAE